MLTDTRLPAAAPSAPLASAELLPPSFVAKPWGRRDGLPAPESAQPLGEVVHDAAGAGLVVKWLQTGAPLSVQLHPQRAGRKHEWWYVAEARPDAWLLLGLKRPATPEQLRAAAGDGTLPDMLRRIAPRPGQTFHVPPGTIHALGPGLTVIEVQEPSDVTFRLFDYGRGRALHLDAALNEAVLAPAPLHEMPPEGAPFGIAVHRLRAGQRLTLAAPRACVAVVEGTGTLGARRYKPQECWQTRGPLALCAETGSTMIVAAPRAAAETGPGQDPAPAEVRQ